MGAFGICVTGALGICEWGAVAGMGDATGGCGTAPAMPEFGSAAGADGKAGMDCGAGAYRGAGTI